MNPPTPLQRELADRILAAMREREMKPGDHLNENSLARELNVSRSPVRAALAQLASQGIVTRKPRLGIELLREAPPPQATPAAAPDTDEENDLLIRIAGERRCGGLSDEVSETELMRRFDVARPLLQRALRQLAESGAVERKPGYGWRFLVSAQDDAARRDGYRFRLLIEPQAMLEPGFEPDPSWLRSMRAAHRRALTAPWRRGSSIAFFEMNAAFHEGLAAASGNRFILAAVRRQSQLRRFSNYDWSFGIERVQVNCREHLEILDRIEAEDREMASLLMRRHLVGAMRLRRDGTAAPS